MNKHKFISELQLKLKNSFQFQKDPLYCKLKHSSQRKIDFPNEINVGTQRYPR